MQLINKKNFLPIVCIVYTILSFSKIIFEIKLGYKDPNYVENFIMLFLMSLIATFVLSLHYYLQKIPLPIVILGQYIFLVGIIMLSIWIGGHLQNNASTAYRDMFWSFTIPYIIGAIIYYAVILFQIKKANKTLSELKKEG
jgi:hypothetical protein